MRSACDVALSNRESERCAHDQAAEHPVNYCVFDLFEIDDWDGIGLPA
jgi:hypothetical protein